MKPRRQHLERALFEAVLHVRRQVSAGRHAQDREDAETWLTDHAAVVRSLKDHNPSRR